MMNARRSAGAIGLFCLGAIGFSANAQSIDYVRLIDANDRCGKRALNTETGALEMSEYSDGWVSAQWERTTLPDGTFSLKNKWTDDYVTLVLTPIARSEQEIKQGANISPEGVTSELKMVKAGETLTSVNLAIGKRVQAPVEDSRGIMWTATMAGDYNHLTSAIVNATLHESKRGNFDKMQMAYDVAKDSPRACASKVTADASGDMKSPLILKIVSTGESTPEQKAEAAKYQFIYEGDTGRALNIETGEIASSPTQPGWLSAQWRLETLGEAGRHRLRNLWTGQYLAVSDGKLKMSDAASDEAMKKGQDPNGDVWRIGLLSTNADLKNPDDKGYVFIKNVKSGKVLASSSGRLSLSDSTTSSRIWQIGETETAPTPAPVAAPDYVRLTDTKGGNALHIENDEVEVGEFEPGWWSAQWVLSEHNEGKQERVVRIKNRWKDTSLVVMDGKVKVVKVDAAPSNKGPRFDDDTFVLSGLTSTGATLKHMRSGLYLSASTLALSEDAPGDKWVVRPVE